MAPDAPSAGEAERLASELFDREPGEPMATEIASWMGGSKRFRAFVATHRGKIRKKLRSATDADARRDVRAELRVAHLLLADRRVVLAFEAFGSRAGGPDFTIDFRGERSFNLEVTRLRRPPGVGSAGRVLLAKLRQLPPSAPNALLVAVDGDRADALDVAAAVHELRARADAKDDAFFAGHALGDARGFYQRFLRLGAVLVWCEAAAGDARAGLWTNPSARIAVPERATRACLTGLRAG
jgi:hypothetical protein